MNKALKKYNEWVANNRIYKTWDNEDYENVVNVEDVNGDVLCVESDENGNIIDVWEE